ncbi:hypothetical protein MP638_006812 [Amoeboaphelidium occidentale]|nr:hypothetical protein MP638_006812 [Amoeboaphelidium occidentale]
MEFLLLGTAQDAGLPQTSCKCINCTSARALNLKRQYAVGAAIIDHDLKQVYLLDCTPDFKDQYDILEQHAPSYKIEGVFLTHLHMGHYVGLYQFGREVMDRKNVKLYVTKSMALFFKQNAPWKFYIENGNFILCEVETNSVMNLRASFSIELLPVPHRGEFSDTVAFKIKGSNKSIFYCPDIDSWDKWLPQVDIRNVVSLVDYAFLDACFYDHNELPYRNRHEIPHPLVIDTIKRLQEYANKVYLIHLNHTNPLHRSDSEQYKSVTKMGYHIPEHGNLFKI